MKNEKKATTAKWVTNQSNSSIRRWKDLVLYIVWFCNLYSNEKILPNLYLLECLVTGHANMDKRISSRLRYGNVHGNIKSVVYWHAICASHRVSFLHITPPTSQFPLFPNKQTNKQNCNNKTHLPICRAFVLFSFADLLSLQKSIIFASHI